MRLLTVLLAGALLAACQTPCPSPQSSSREARFTCEDGSELRVTFSANPDGAVVAQDGYTAVSLTGRIAGSGYRYTDEGAEFRSRGMEAYWLRPGAEETLCREIP